LRRRARSGPVGSAPAHDLYDQVDPPPALDFERARVGLTALVSLAQILKDDLGLGIG